MKKSDYSIEKGIEKLEFKRLVTIEGVDSFLKVELKQNNRKGSIQIITKMDNGQITGDETQDAATALALSELQEEALISGIKWRTAWNKSNKKEDPDQIKMPLN